MARIERVSYHTGFVQRLEKSAHLPALTIAAPDLPEDVLTLLDHHPSTLAAPTTIRTWATPFSTTSYASSTTRAPWRSSPTRCLIGCSSGKYLPACA